MEISDEYRAKADECFRLAKDASTKQERSRHLGSALTLLLAATRHDGVLPVLPLVPGLASVLCDRTPGEDSSNDMLREILDAIPRSSTITFSADQLGALFSAGGPLGVGTEVGARVEDLARHVFVQQKRSWTSYSPECDKRPGLPRNCESSQKSSVAL